MKKDVINRYERDPQGHILIDVAAGKVEALYNDFDRSAPFIRRDLDQDLVDYLIDCAEEIGKEKFTLCFSLAEQPDESRRARIRHSLRSYFLSLAEVERRKVRKMLRRSLVLFLIGVGILFLSVWLNQSLGEDRSVVSNVFAEGLTVAAWVSLWEALAIFAIEWFPFRENIRLFRTLATTETVFRARPGTVLTPG